MNQDLMSVIEIKKERAFVSSLVVAEQFEKEHKNVLRDIEALEIDDKFRQLNFELTSYVDIQNKERKSYKITRDGFMLLVMGFTGNKAMKMKVAFIEAFNRMENAIRQQIKNAADEQWKIARATGKSIRSYETDIIQRFVAYATDQGSESAKMYYANITKMEYKALGLIDLLDHPTSHRRDILNCVQIGHLMTAESIAAKAIQKGMDAKLPYKQIYVLAKEEVMRFVDLVGTTSIGETPLQSLGVEKRPQLN